MRLAQHADHFHLLFLCHVCVSILVDLNVRVTVRFCLLIRSEYLLLMIR